METIYFLKVSEGGRLRVGTSRGRGSRREFVVAFVFCF